MVTRPKILLIPKWPLSMCRPMAKMTTGASEEDVMKPIRKTLRQRRLAPLYIEYASVLNSNRCDRNTGQESFVTMKLKDWPRPPN